jgi:hypothetical protein
MNGYGSNPHQVNASGMRIKNTYIRFFTTFLAAAFLAICNENRFFLPFCQGAAPGDDATAISTFNYKPPQVAGSALVGHSPAGNFGSLLTHYAQSF